MTKFFVLVRNLIEFLHSIDDVMGLRSENVVNLQEFKGFTATA